MLIRACSARTLSILTAQTKVALSRIVKQVTKLKFNVDIATLVTQSDDLSTFFKGSGFS